MRIVGHSSMDRDRYTATQDVPLLSLIACQMHILARRKSYRERYKHSCSFTKQHVFTEWWCRMINLGCAPAPSVSQPTQSCWTGQPERPVSSQVDHFIWNFIFCSFSYSLSQSQWNSCHFLAAGGIKSHCCLYKLAFLLFHFLLCPLKMDRVKEHFLLAKTKQLYLRWFWSQMPWIWEMHQYLVTHFRS